MSIEAVMTNDAPAPAWAYSQAVLSNGTLYTAGFGPVDPQTGKIVGDTVEEQTEQVMKNLKAVLAAKNLDFSNVVKTTVHLQDLDRDFQGFNAVYETFLSTPYPVRTTVGSTLAGILVEIDLVAHV